MPAQAMTAAGTPAERQTVLHSWCIHQHPRVVGRLLGEPGACVSGERNS
ncbi:MAG TPA: hypothetical protein VGH61_07170 [Steroidobacteraceae bacterium]